MNEEEKPKQFTIYKKSQRFTIYQACHSGVWLVIDNKYPYQSPIMRWEFKEDAQKECDDLNALDEKENKSKEEP